MRLEVRSISIRAMRQAKGLAQWQLAEMIGVKQESITQWETGKTSPRFERLVDIAKALDCTVDDLIKKED